MGTGPRDFRFSIDRGGTFTDVFAEFVDAEGNPGQRVLKLLSEDPANYPDAPREGIRRILEAETGIPHPRSSPVDTSMITSIRMGTTVCMGPRITNARLGGGSEQGAPTSRDPECCIMDIATSDATTHPAGGHQCVAGAQG